MASQFNVVVLQESPTSFQSFTKPPKTMTQLLLCHAFPKKNLRQKNTHSVHCNSRGAGVFIATGVSESRDRCRGTQRHIDYSGQIFSKCTTVTHTQTLCAVVMTQIHWLCSTVPCREITCQRGLQGMRGEVVPQTPVGFMYHVTKQLQR